MAIRNLGPGDDDFDPISQFQNAIRGGPPWDSIVDFATHRSFCGMRLYPRQLTLLKLIYLETEMMTAYDIDVIEQWRQGFKDRTNPMGVQPDIWDRVTYLKNHGYHHFPHVQMVMGRRASKGIIGGVIGAERLAYFYSLDNWQQHFGIRENAVGELTVIATSQAQAAKRQFADIRNTVEQCTYLRPHIVGNKYTEFSIRTPSDVRHIDSMRAEGVPLDREFATLYCVASSSVSTSQRGGAGIMNAYDEMAHMLMGTGSTKSGEEIYEAYQPSLDQFGIHKMTYVPSSPYTKIGQFFQLYKHGCVLMDEYIAREGRVEKRIITEQELGLDQDVVEEELEAMVADPEMLVVQLPSWATYQDWDTSTTIPMRPNRTRCFPRWKRPVQYDPTGEAPENKAMARMRQRNPEKFKVERAAQFASVQDAYLNEVMVDKMFEKPWWRDELVAQDRGFFSLVYRAHADPSRTNANFGFAIGHMEDAPCDGCGWDPNVLPGNVPPASKYTHRCKEGGHVWPHVIIDKLHVWKPEDFPNHTINYVTVGDDLKDFLRRWQSIKLMTYDQFNSPGFVDTQKMEFPHIRIMEKTFTVQENQNRFEKFKAALNLGLVHSYKDTFFEEGQSLLETELKFLQEKNGKVDKQEFGPCTTKDLADAVMVVTVDILEEHLERWYGGRNRLTFGSTNAAGLRAGREQERLTMVGAGARQINDPASLRAAQNRQNLERFNANRAQSRERGYRDSTIPSEVDPNRRRNRRGIYAPTRTRGRWG